VFIRVNQTNWTRMGDSGAEQTGEQREASGGGEVGEEGGEGGRGLISLRVCG